MNVSEYISSGILESYALDQLSDSERGEVDSMVAQYPELREELEKIEASIESLAFSGAVAPPVDLKKQILGAIDKVDTPVIAMNQDGSGSLMKYAAAASITIALVSSFLAFSYWNKWKLSEIQLSELVAQNQQFADNYNQVNQQLGDIQKAVGVMNNSAYSRVIMNGTDNAPGSLATIYWNKSTEDVYLNIQQLKELSEDQQYQLWAIIDGKPVDAGVFDLGSDNFLVQMKNISDGAAAFAVTIEPKGGSESPTLETMQVLGNV